MATTTISPKFQVVIPKEVRDKLHLSPKQRLQVLEKGGVITLVPEVPLKTLKGALRERLRVCRKLTSGKRRIGCEGPDGLQRLDRVLHGWAAG